MQLIVSEVAQNDGLSALIRRFRDVLNLEKGPWIAGGAARRLYLGENDLGTYGDIDLFVPHSRWHEITDEVRHIDLPFANRVTRGLVETLRFNWKGKNTKLQLITAKHKMDETPSIQRVFETFDFTVCCFATDGYQIVATPEAIADERARVIRPIEGYNQIGKFPRRVAKYVRYGYTPAPGALKQLVGTIKGVTPACVIEDGRDEYYDS